MPGVVPHHDHVRRVVEQLQNPRQDQRPGKPQNLRQQRPAGHIHFMPRMGMQMYLPHTQLSPYLAVKTIRVSTGGLKIRPGCHR